MFSRITPAAFALAALLLSVQTTFSQTANFTSNVTEGCFPLTVKFEDTSTGTITNWSWNFGNNNTSTLQDPEAVFTAPGVYDVTLTVRNGSGSPSTRIRSAYIIVHDYPAVDFSFDKTSGCAPLTVKFKDQTSTASGAIDSWFWVFGDGATSTSANPSHTFQTPGNKTVSLSVRNEFGCTKLKSTATPINVLGPTAKFVPDHQSVCTLPAAFQFTNQSTGQGLTFQWDFGDGQTSTAKDPSHTYNNSGSYEVKLKAKDVGGCEQTFSIIVNAGSEGGLDFDMSTTKVCLGTPIDFELESDDPPTSVTWNFGDGSDSHINDPTHTYSIPGTYTITLTALLLDHACNSVVKKTVLVASPAVPSFDYDIACDYKLTLRSTSQNASRLEWIIEDEETLAGQVVVSPFKRYGLQHVKLIAYDAAECSASTESDVFVPPNPSPRFTPEIQQSCEPGAPSLSGCAPFTLTFENQTTSSGPYTVQWDFGDGGTSTSTTVVPHTYTTKGLYQVSLTATNDKGCSETTVNFVQVKDVAPQANFTISKTEACTLSTIQFSATSEADTYCWFFGDDEVGTGKVTSHEYEKPGVYSVKLIAKNAGCSAEKEIVNAITILDPYVKYEMAKGCGDPYNVSIQNLSTNYDDLRWDFGDGNESTDANLTSHRYTQEGTYNLILLGRNLTTGCLSQYKQTVHIQEINADFEVNTDRPCKGAPLTFTDDSHAVSIWEWDIAGQSSPDPNPTVRIRTAGDYTAKLTVTDSDGCQDSKSIPIKVLDMEGDFRFSATSTCDEFTVPFENLSTGTPPPTSWLWDFGDGDTSTDEEPVHVYDELGEYSVTLEVTSPEGTCLFSKGGAVVFTNPIPGFTTTKNEFCPDDLVKVANTTTNAVIYEWDYGDGRRADFEAPSIVYTETGSYDIALFATDAFGCEKKLVKEDFIIIEKPTADFSVASPSGACPPFTAIFSDESESNIEEWQWDFGDGGQSTLQDPANVYLKPGNFDVKLTVKDKNGCVDSKTASQFVSVGGPTGNFSPEKTELCTSDLVNFTATVTNAVMLKWDFGDGNVEETTDGEATHAYASVGTFTPALLLIDAQGCENLADGAVSLFVKDTTAFTISISPTCIKAGEPISMKASTEGDDIVAYDWWIDGIEQGSGATFETTLDDPGLHVVMGRAINTFACLSRVMDTVRIQGPLTMIPNVITPNGDTRNQSFKIIGLDNSTWNIDILNRWGNTVYRKKGYTGDWDGEEQPAGVYYYILRNAMCEDRDYKGFISIVR